MKTNHTYKCSEGHISTLMFDESAFKLPCPKCGTTIYRYRDEINSPGSDDTETLDTASAVRKKIVPLKNKIMAIALVVGFFGGITSLMLYKPHVQPTVKLADMPKVEPTQDDLQPADVDAKKSPSPLRGVRNIEIANFSGEVLGTGDSTTVRVRLTLINHGDPATPYPDLRLRWRGSEAQDVVLTNDQYAHPTTPFTRLDIATELPKPAQAKGIDVQLNESNNQ